MTAKQRNLFFIGSILSVFVMAVAVIFGKKLAFSPLLVKGSGAEINNSVTFNSFSNVNGHAECTKSLRNGGGVKAYSTRSLSNGAVVVSATQFVFFSFNNNGVENSSLTIGETNRECAPFENLTSIKITYSGTGGMTINYSTNGTSWSTTTSNSDSVNSAISGAKYVYLSTASGTSYLSSIVLSYSCTGSEPEPESSLSGKTFQIIYYEQLACTLSFTSGTQGVYTYVSAQEDIYFSYVVDGSSITFTYISGNNHNCGNWCLFNGSTSPVPNSTFSIYSETSLKGKTYNNWGSAYNRTFTLVE